MINQKSLLSGLFLILINIVVGLAATDAAVEPPYTENMTEFKEKKHFNARSQKLLGCWLYLRQQGRKQGAKQFQDHQWLHLMKKCLQKISRKDAVLKITQLGKRNMQPVTPFSQILNVQQEFSSEIKLTELSEFDAYLLSRSQDFAKQLSQILEKGNIDAQIQQQLKKRQKYYFGIIPASMVSHTTILITMTMLMMCCCTWFRLYRGSSEKMEEKKNQRLKEENEQYQSMLKSKNSKLKTKKSKNK